MAPSGGFEQRSNLAAIGEKQTSCSAGGNAADDLNRSSAPNLAGLHGNVARGGVLTCDLRPEEGSR
jgi:hypothetical protein